MAVAETIWAEDMDEMLCRAFSLAFWSCQGNKTHTHTHITIVMNTLELFQCPRVTIFKILTYYILPNGEKKLITSKNLTMLGHMFFMSKYLI